jgi:hypothetical protein
MRCRETVKCAVCGSKQRTSGDAHELCAAHRDPKTGNICEGTGQSADWHNRRWAVGFVANTNLKS